MAPIRTVADLSIHDGPHRSFEWFWEDNETMPGVDAYESLSGNDQDDCIASIEHGANSPAGSQPRKSRVNVESTEPLVVAIKAGSIGSPRFKEESGLTWIVYAHYLKEGGKRDKTGDRALSKKPKAPERGISQAWKMGHIMNAREARKIRGGSTLVERVKDASPVRAARIKKLVAQASVEQMVQAIMADEQVTAAELARRIRSKPPQISRELRGGLSRATLGRLSSIADALGYDFVPTFVPRNNTAKRKRFMRFTKASFQMRGWSKKAVKPQKAKPPSKSRVAVT